MVDDASKECLADKLDDLLISSSSSTDSSSASSSSSSSAASATATSTAVILSTTQATAEQTTAQNTNNNQIATVTPPPATTTTTTTTPTSTDKSIRWSSSQLSSTHNTHQQQQQRSNALTIQDVFDPLDTTTHLASSNHATILLAAAATTMATTAAVASTAITKTFNFGQLKTPTNFNTFSNNCINLNMKARQDALMNKRASNAGLLLDSLTSSGGGGVGVASNNINNTSGYMDFLKGHKLNNNEKKNANMMSANGGGETKYQEYKRRWIEILRKEKSRFLSKWLASNSSNSSSSTSVKLTDYEVRKTLGNGSFGRVVLAKHKESGKFYALKIMDKKNIVESK